MYIDRKQGGNKMLKFSDEKVVGTAVIKKELTEDDIATIIINGFEGGINYWAGLDVKDKPEWAKKPKDEPRATWATKLILEGEEILLYDIEEPDGNEVMVLTLDGLIKGYELNAKERPWDSDIENGDAGTADAIIQYAIFGKLVFG
jgi:hypothetical protein